MIRLFYKRALASGRKGLAGLLERSFYQIGAALLVNRKALFLFVSI